MMIVLQLKQCIRDLSVTAGIDTKQLSSTRSTGHSWHRSRSVSRCFGTRWGHQQRSCWCELPSKSSSSCVQFHVHSVDAV